MDTRKTAGSVTSTVRRAAGFAVVGTGCLAVPALGESVATDTAAVAAAAPFLLLAGLGLYVVDDGPLFELFARPGDREEGRLFGLASFSLTIAGLAILTVQFGMPVAAFVGSVLALSYGNLGEQVVRRYTTEDILGAAGFTVAGGLAALAGQAAAASLTAAPFDLPVAAFLGVAGALLAALLRTVLFTRDDPLVLSSVGLLLWLFADLSLSVTTTRVVVALAVTAGLGYVSYALETASLPGMLTGVFLGLLTIVLGDYGWFAMLITFFGVGGLSTKFRYDEKLSRGVAQENEGARGSGNVLANSLAALAAVLAAAASPAYLPVPPTVFLFAFAGAVAAALADTLSSEIGGLFDNPRLITTLRRVDPGTDGAVTWQGELAGLTGAAVIAGIAVLAFPTVGALGGAVVVAAGFVGMTVDSVVGATLEGGRLDNEAVNFVATLSAAVAGGLLAVALGVAPL
jgi:uncharacterized protein (TIGR00297 family)